MIQPKLKKILAEILILFIKTILFLKKIVAFVLYNLIYKPIKSILNFLFFRISIKAYYNYILIYKKIKEINRQNNSKLYIIKKNYPILIISLILVSIISHDLNASSNDFSNNIHKTALAQNIVTDFENVAPEELIVEIGYNDASIATNPNTYMEQEIAALNKTDRIIINTNEEQETSLISTESLSRPAISTTDRARDARTEILEYTIQSGDTISSIAQEFGLNTNTILWENNLTARSLIRPGNTIRVLPEDGLMHTVARNETISGIAKKYNIASNEIILANNLADSDVLNLGQKIFIPGGKKIIVPAPVTRPAYTGTTIAQTVPTAPTTSYTGGKLLWPTVGTRITQYYSWRHQGLDIANRTGTPLIASESGVVERSGWGTGYGYYVTINHGGGLKTLYAHASKLHVRVGDKVNRGDVVADMGSTGWSTGPHIHYEVILNGVKQNPLDYIR